MKITSAEMKRLLELALSATLPVASTLQFYDALKRAHQLAADGRDITVAEPPVPVAATPVDG